MKSSSHHVRGRAPLRNPVLNQTSRQQPLPRYNPVALSRPRSFIFNPLSPTSTFSDPKKPRLFSLRIPSSHLVISTIAIAFFIFGVVVSSNVSTVLVSARANDIGLSIQTDQSSTHPAYRAFPPANNSAPNSPPNPDSTNHTPQTEQPPLEQPQSTSNKPAHSLTSDSAPETQTSQNTSSASSEQSTSDHLVDSVKAATETEADPPPPKIKDGRVNWNRSWPVLPDHDETDLIPLAKSLKFDNNTMLNYFHMHKTGGVTLKSELMTVINNPMNKLLATKRGYGLKYAETCYEVTENINDKSLEGTWRCDFGNLQKLTPTELKQMDIIMGHQYWDLGTEDLFSPYRRVRHFSLFRHPLPRKLSFFYHFFVRNLGRDEKHVTKDEVIKFVLGEEMPDDPCSRDAGPNYYASRLLSDGLSGFDGNRYVISEQKSNAAISKVSSKFENDYALIGLQVQSEASQCMLEKLVQVFAHGRGIDNLVGTPKLSFHSAKLNSGGYPWTSQRLWRAMTPEQKQKYREVERVDLAIYKLALERFREDVKRYSCEDKVSEEEFSEDTYE